MKAKLQAVPFTQVSFNDSFWQPRQDINRSVTLPTEHEQCEKTGRLSAWKLNWKPGMPNPPHIFWDSDVAKWIEAAAYSLKTQPDKKLEKQIDDIVALMAKAQAKDGYLNSHYLAVEPDKRWSNLRDNHELYCAGHLMEAAVAYYEATGKRVFLDIMCRYTDLIAAVFGRGPGQKRGYCGHEEIELALVKIYRATGEKRYLDLASYFIDERGQTDPHYYDVEAIARGDDPTKYWAQTYAYMQADKPVRQQERLTGHAVRALYLYSGMADVARETGDAALSAALLKLWNHMSMKLLYVTGGVGSSKHNEGFTFDYDLPNETAYCETCASVALVFWAHRMLHLTGESRFADVMERTLYNAALAGINLKGDRFFYANPLAVLPAASQGTGENTASQRQGWFGCACCPPNIARLIASAGEYIYSVGSDDSLRINLYAQSHAQVTLDGVKVTVQQQTRFPWAGTIRLRLIPERTATFTVALRIPDWSPSFSLTLNGKRVRPIADKGYARITRPWCKSDVLTLNLDMSVLRMEAHPKVRMNTGRVALQRGPLVYCLEQEDNGPDLNDITLPANARFTAKFEKSLLGGVVTLNTKGSRRDAKAWPKGTLYRFMPAPRRPVAIKAVPYCTWGNRSPGEMLVWLVSTAR